MEIKINNVSKKLNKRMVLKDIDLTFKSGNIYLLEGINGSGKTMLLRLISGLVSPTDGQVLVDGQPLLSNQFIPDAGVLIGHTELPGEYTALTNMQIIRDIKSDDSDEQLLSYLEMMNIGENANELARTFSMGMNQKLALAQTMIGDPSIWLLDEPLNSLDKKMITKYIEFLVTSKKEKIIIIAAHNSEELRLIADHTITLDDGEVYDQI